MATVPSWWLQGATQINPLEQTYGFDGSQSDRFGMNNYDAILRQLGFGGDWLGGAPDDPSQGSFRAQDVQDWLASNGYQMMSNQGAGIGGGADTYQNLNWLQDAQGNLIGDPTFNRDDPNGVLKMAALAAAGYFGGSALAGAGGAAATTGGMSAAEQAAFMAANGMTDAEIAAAMGTAGSNAAGLTGVSGGMSAAGALTPMDAGIESLKVTVPETMTNTALGTTNALSPELQAIAAGGSMAGGTVPAGYGTYTGAASGAGGLLGDAAQWAAQNPKLIGAVAGGLMGAGGGSSGGSSGGGASGPAPTISRGQWSASATPTYMQVPTFGGQLPTTGNANSGLWRYAGANAAGSGQAPAMSNMLPAGQGQSSLLPAPQAPSLLGPANQTQWQQPTGPTFNMSGQQLNQGSAMTQPTQPTFSGVGYGSPAVDTTTPSPVSSGGSPSTAPAGFADLYRNHIGNSSMSDEDAASRLATAARRYQMFGQSSDGVFGFNPESFKAYQAGNLDAFKGAIGSPVQRAPDPMYRYTGNAAGQAASDQAFANLDAQRKGILSQPGGPVFSGVGGLLGGTASIQNKTNQQNKV